MQKDMMGLLLFLVFFSPIFAFGELEISTGTWTIQQGTAFTITCTEGEGPYSWYRNGASEMELIGVGPTLAIPGTLEPGSYWVCVEGSFGEEHYMWCGFIIEESPSQRTFTLRLHGNGVTTAEGAGEVDLEGQLFGEDVMLPTDLFTTSANVPGEDMSGRLMGWLPGTGRYDASTSSEQLFNESFWLPEEDIETWTSQGVAEEIGGELIVHFYAIWKSQVTVTVSDADGWELFPPELLNLVKFNIRYDNEEPEWKTNKRTVLVPPGEQGIWVELDSGFDAHYAVRVLKDKTELASLWPGCWVYDISSATGTRNVALEVWVETEEGMGNVDFNCKGELTAEQKAAWGEKFSPFDVRLAQIKVWPREERSGSGMLVGTMVGLPAGAYRAEIEYKGQIAGGQPWWGGPNREIILKEFEIERGKTTEVEVEFLPFGSRTVDYRWIEFLGNGGEVKGNSVLWFGKWSDTGGTSLNVRTLPRAESGEGWTHTGWGTYTGESIGTNDWEALDRWLRNHLGNATLTAKWLAVPNEWLEEHAAEALAANGGDYGLAAASTAANGMAVWECYVAGLSTTNVEEEFTTSITFSNGVPNISWVPDLNEGGKKAERTYVVEGKPAMMDEWGATNAASRFFRVKVALP